MNMRSEAFHSHRDSDSDSLTSICRQYIHVATTKGQPIQVSVTTYNQRALLTGDGCCWWTASEGILYILWRTNTHNEWSNCWSKATSKHQKATNICKPTSKHQKVSKLVLKVSSPTASDLHNLWSCAAARARPRASLGASL